MSSATSAAATTSSTAPTAPTATVTEDQPKFNPLPNIDLRCFTQSELYSLSLFSPPASDPFDETVIPKIDRSVFNESAGSRKQTYSRLRLAPAADSTTVGRRNPRLRVTNPPVDAASLPSDTENANIVTLLKHLFAGDGTNTAELDPISVDYSNSVPQLESYSNSVPQLTNVESYSNSLPQIANLSSYSNPLYQTPNVGGSTGTKRKRGRPRKNENALPLLQDQTKTETELDNKMSITDIVIFQNKEDKDKEITNKDGVDIDLIALGSLNDPYGDELSRRTQGLVNEDQLMGFMRDLNGEWGSRRKKKRIVDASEFGNTLPKHWKLQLTLKKKEGRIWVHCRNYISPNGRHFSSCKEVSLYLLSLHGVNPNMPNHEIIASSPPNVQQEIQMVPHNSSTAITCVYSNNTNEQPKLQIGQIFPCKKCKMDFYLKDELLQHKLSFHSKKKRKGDESITDGVIIKEGKFECQFCHKTFTEKIRYNGHMGAHVKNQVVNTEECAVISEVPKIESVNKQVEAVYSNGESCSPCLLTNEVNNEEKGKIETEEKRVEFCSFFPEEETGNVFGNGENMILDVEFNEKKNENGYNNFESDDINGSNIWEEAAKEEEADFFKVTDFEDIVTTEGSNNNNNKGVEYSFMGESSNNAAPCYDAVMEKSFDPFWVTKDNNDNMMQNASELLIKCVWCGSEFLPENSRSGGEGNATIGSLCPNCCNGGGTMQFTDANGGNF